MPPPTLNSEEPVLQVNGVDENQIPIEVDQACS